MYKIKDEPDWGLYDELMHRNSDKTNQKPVDYEIVYRSETEMDDDVNYQRLNVGDQLRAVWNEPEVDVKPKLEYIEADLCQQQSIERWDEEFVEDRNGDPGESLVESKNTTESIKFDISGTQPHDAHDQLTKSTGNGKGNIARFIVSKQSDDHSSVCFANDEFVGSFIGDKKLSIEEYKQGTTDPCSNTSKMHSLLDYKGAQDDDKPFKCDYCHKLFRLKVNLGAHMKIHKKEFSTATDAKPSKGKANKDKLRRRKIHHSTHTLPKEYLKRLQYEQELVQCDFCREKIQRRNLKRHKKMHIKDKTKIECHICKKRFLQKVALRIHMITHKEKSTREKFECSICRKQFLQSNGLAYHMDTHKIRNMVQCSICPKKFLSECGLKSHMITHADKSTRERIKCKLCDKTFLQTNGLAYHMKMAHKKHTHIRHHPF